MQRDSMSGSANHHPPWVEVMGSPEREVGAAQRTGSPVLRERELCNSGGGQTSHIHTQLLLSPGKPACPLWTPGAPTRRRCRPHDILARPISPLPRSPGRSW